MGFDMIRFGWPNTSAIAALAIMPFVALAMPAERRPALAVQTEQVEPAAICPMPADCATIATAASETFVE